MWELLLAILAFFNVSATPTPSTQVNPGEKITINNKTYVVYRQEIFDITLVPNFTEQKTSVEIMKQCTYGVNGGFYSTDNTPIGLFSVQNNVVSHAKTNATLNGFFLKKANGAYTITTDVPSGNMHFALQSGPYITPQTILTIKNDTYARRILVARSGEAWYFIAMTDQENSFSGPLLEELPRVVSLLGMEEALNLDGGSASAFYSQSGVHLGELTPVGSFFCGH